MLDLVNSGLLDLIRIQRKIPRIRARRKRRRFRQRIFWRDRGICAYCDQPVPFDRATLDHVTPLVCGGSDRLKENFVVSCSPCNKAKAQLILEFLDDLEPDKLREKFKRNCAGK